ncbi:hypothetical protein SCHPADRAFT_905925 [Schizopora paradoxa]|uniref:Uncharacterized protein n=1 Tax=Schizopora paradoxa TaxID=27342 RepID=A0A0H2S3Q9_9AGAM|nr:hypothetical protein SCHPADRAFT_905925 [Schizopora paradoxa]
MRAKDILRRIPLSSRIRLVYERITLTRFTTCYISLILAVCVVQAILHSFVLANNAYAKYYLGEIIEKVGEPVRFAFVKNDVLMVCDKLPLPGDTDACWPLTPNVSVSVNAVSLNGNGTTGSSLGDTGASSYGYKRSMLGMSSLEKRHKVQPQFDSNGTLQEVVVSNIAASKQPVTLSPQCVAAIQWPEILLHEAMSEDVVFLTFQLWLFGMALMTVLNESIPHLCAGLAGLALSTGWVAFQIRRNDTFETLFRVLVTQDSCNGIDLLGPYWAKRRAFFIPILTFNIISLLLSAYLSFNLFKIYAQESFKRVGADAKLNRLYKIILVFSVFLQLSVFFTISSSAMWVDELSTGAVRKVADNGVDYIVIFSITCAMELPWLIIGWMAIRQENRTLTWLFFGVGTFLIVVWAAMFGSTIYLWTFQNSPFFATMTITAFLILVTTMGLAIVCRLNFGKGLLEFLRMQQTFDHFEFETVLPETKRVSVGGDWFGGMEKGQKRLSLVQNSNTTGVGNGAKRISTAVARMSRQIFGSTGSAGSDFSSTSTVIERDEKAKKNVNPYTRAREMDKLRSAASVVDIKKSATKGPSLAALSSPAAFKKGLGMKRAISSTSAAVSVAQSWSVAATDLATAPVPPVPAHLSSQPSSVRTSEDGGDERHRSTASLPKLKTLQLPANRLAGLTISPDPFRSEGMKSGWY